MAAHLLIHLGSAKRVPVIEKCDDLWVDLIQSMPVLEELYRDLHRHPELAGNERRTAAEVALRLSNLGLEVAEQVGETGVVGVLRNGDGPVVMLRADMDGLPVLEQTGLPYASEAKVNSGQGGSTPLMHACGHDMHVTCLLGAATLLARRLGWWRGTLLTVFQPAEETATGAQAMLDDDFLRRFPSPDLIFGQHVDGRPAGVVGIRAGVAMGAAVSLRVRLRGRGGHGSQPHTTVDPIVLAAMVIVRLQTVVAREVSPTDSAVLTVGTIHAGLKENILPDEAEITINIRAFSESVKDRVVDAAERVVRAEANASGAPEPVFERINMFPVTMNDPSLAASAVEAFRRGLGDQSVEQIAPKLGSEDFGRFGLAAGVPSLYWFLGGTDPVKFAAARTADRISQDVPGNHSSRFAPVIQPTLTVGVKSLVVAVVLAPEWIVRQAEGGIP